MNARPQTLHEVATRAETLAHFGQEFADWLHTLRTLHSRAQIQQRFQSRPPLLSARFPEGHIADAWLAAYADYIAQKLSLKTPTWANAPERRAKQPWFSKDTPSGRARAQREAPEAFQKRNVFTDAVDLPLRLRAGRPPKSEEEKRQTNATRQRRFRTRRAVENDLLHASLQNL